MSENFTQFYKRTTGFDYPGNSGEELQVVLRRMAEALAAWADEIAARVERRER